MMNKGEEMRQRDILERALKERWLTAYQMQQVLKSSSADRIMRFIRECPPVGFTVESRQKKVKGYNTCNEYRLLPI